MLEPIAEGSLDDARSALSRGFPTRPPSFWAEGLDRQAAFQAAAGLGPLGYLLRVKGDVAGVILTMRSLRRDAAGADRLVVNLSSWYVEERYRLLAPRMIRQVLAEPADVFTDLTPSPSVTEMMGRLGFARRHDGGMIVLLPAAAMLAAGPGRVTEIAEADVDPGLHGLIRDHVALGCVACLLRDGAEVHPLVFSTAFRKGLPMARLVYGADAAAVRRNIGPLARFLLRRGIACLEVPANHGEAVAGGWFSRRARPTFVRGEPPAAEVDHAYSEFVFLRI